ncbi:MAG: hypothetical protein JKY37_18770 [Nannocystaceae bacterium]|nr:hypothetical protein [Nannocystaceae bacterium]
MDQAAALDHQTLESYFFGEIEQLAERNGHALPENVEAYIVGLLTRYARRPQAAGRKSRPIALEYMRARGETGAARAHALRGVGDRALYISGVAPRSLHRAPVSVKYFQGIGAAAYREVASNDGPLAVLGEVAERFEAVAEVIGDVVELGAEKTPDLLAIYERWRKLHDPRDARRLVAAGVLINAEGSDVLQ